MNLTLVARLLAGFTLFFTALTLVPLTVALLGEDQRFDTTRGFLTVLVAGLSIALVLRILGRAAQPDFFRREALAVVGFAWVIAGVLGALPLLASGALDRVSDAIFESISGLTTTGATVLNSGGNPAPESLPDSLLLWRSLLQWVGGTGVILVFTVLLPAIGLTGKSLLDSEAVGVARHDERPRVREQARQLFKLYVVLTLLAFGGYYAAGMGAFDALCHAMTTLSTGGFSTRDYSLGEYQNGWIEACAILFMFVGGINFVLMLSAVRGRDLRRLRDNPELRGYAAVTAGAIVTVALFLRAWGRAIPDVALGHVEDYGSIGTCLRDAAFQVVSILTTTGFANTNFQNWPSSTLFVLLACMVIGGCTGSTAGGFKVLRLLVCLKLIGFQIRRFIQPRTVEKLKLGNDVLPNGVVSAILVLLLLWVGISAIGTFVLALDPRLDAFSALTASVSQIGCVGPAFTSVLSQPDGSFAIANPGQIDLGPYGGFGELAAPAKFWLSVQMVFGRLEVLAPLTLFVPAFWRR